MDNNETMRRLRWALSLDDREAARLMALGGLDVPPEDAAAWRRREDDDGAAPCPDAGVAALLDGLVRDRRGPPPTTPGDAPDTREVPGAPGVPGTPVPAPARMDNNAVLKALRIALQLRGEDIAELVRAGTRANGAHGPNPSHGGPSGAAPPAAEPTLSSSEIGSLLRKPGTRNYRRCGDQVLRRFLAGLALRERGEADAAERSVPAAERAS